MAVCARYFSGTLLEWALSPSESSTQSGEEKFSACACPVCGKVLCNYFIMKRHMVLHDKDRTAYRCFFCKKAFKWKHGLMRHCRSAHSAHLRLA
ncbi:hypothetical protein HPB47_022882 [Ixodes persulcatus]|uniref:Uncharacterized protein n=1 Tax=Ixodes persulcatus TaxID=34615 RepID=A0AC60QBQ7_IXOPE|nr:hypothetical protein HPB47_022882 [Ixodes persulcatus]